MKRIYFSFPGNELLANTIALRTGCDIGQSEIRNFPDGESYVRIDTDICAKQVMIVCTLDQPDKKFMGLYFFTKIARAMKAATITLICPYLPYMRQDKSFRPGEGITSVYFAELLSSLVDELITVDPHLHRFHSLNGLYSTRTKTLTAAEPMSKWISDHVNNPFIIGPDSESEQWVKQVAELCNAPYTSLSKSRSGDTNVNISIPDNLDLNGKTPILVDDIISTGKTMSEAIKLLRSRTPVAPICLAVHAVFAGNAYEELKAAGAARIVTTNTVPHVSNQIDVSSLLL